MSKGWNSFRLPAKTWTMIPFELTEIRPRIRVEFHSTSIVDALMVTPQEREKIDNGKRPDAHWEQKGHRFVNEAFELPWSGEWHLVFLNNGDEPGDVRVSVSEVAMRRVEVISGP